MVEEGGFGLDLISVDYVWIVSVSVDVDSAYCLGKVRIREIKIPSPRINIHLRDLDHLGPKPQLMSQIKRRHNRHTQILQEEIRHRITKRRHNRYN